MNNKWQDWVKGNLDRGCNPLEIGNILLKNRFSIPQIRKMMGKSFPTALAENMGQKPAGEPAEASSQQRNTFPANPEVISYPHGAFDQPRAIERLLNSGPNSHKFNIDREAPEGVMIIYDYIDRKTCRALTKYAGSQPYTDLDVVDTTKSTKDKMVRKKDERRITHHVQIDGKACDILNMFVDIYGRQIASFYDVDFEWYERPQILRYPPGGLYNGHADSEHMNLVTKQWHRSLDRDFSVLLYLNDDYEGGELELVNQKFKIKPKPGMLLAFPSDHNYMHAALPTTSGIRYVIVSWAAIVGTTRVHKNMPFGSVYIRQKRSS
jgi:predicted 2-oxoglutarate/Fe(II)-dependent dioxygenase YbiX